MNEIATLIPNETLIKDIERARAIEQSELLDLDRLSQSTGDYFAHSEVSVRSIATPSAMFLSYQRHPARKARCKHKRIICECIGVRIGVIPTAGGEKPIFIMELHNETINEPLIKYLNCNSKTKDIYTVRHNSDFAKLYRLTLGDNPTKRFSKANQLLQHFLGSWFIAKYEKAADKNGVHYLKVTYIRLKTLFKQRMDRYRNT